MAQNTLVAKEIIAEFAIEFPQHREACSSGADTALDGAIMSSLQSLTTEELERFTAIAGRLLNEQEGK